MIEANGTPPPSAPAMPSSAACPTVDRIRLMESSMSASRAMGNEMAGKKGRRGQKLKTDEERKRKRKKEGGGSEREREDEERRGVMR